MVLAWLTLVALSVSAPPDRAVIEQEARRIERLLIAPCCWTQPVSDHYSAEADEIRAGMGGNICRCGNYQKIYGAVAAAGEKMRKG